MNRDKKNKLGLGRESTRTKGKGIVEDATQYGEFVPSFDVWITPDKQREMAEYLEQLGDERRGD